ncbi:MAG: FHA domain-containing protein [Actinomycetes bacterium]
MKASSFDTRTMPTSVHAPCFSLIAASSPGLEHGVAGLDAVPVAQGALTLHARIEVRPGGAAIVDTNSTNGVFVNGKRVQGERSLRDGDRIQAGNTVLETRG